MHENFNFSCAGIDQSAKSTDKVGSANSPVASPVTSPKKLPNRPDVTSSNVGADLED